MSTKKIGINYLIDGYVCHDGKRLTVVSGGKRAEKIKVGGLLGIAVHFAPGAPQHILVTKVTQTKPGEFVSEAIGLWQINIQLSFDGETSTQKTIMRPIKDLDLVITRSVHTEDIWHIRGESKRLALKDYKHLQKVSG
jgi:hypothetical protein